jgi:CheY-like chemotaxis protein
VTARLERVLHVEDDASIRAVARVALEKVGGLTVLSCASGDEALTQAPAFAPQLILLDVMMPDMDGPTTLQRLSEVMDLQAVPVIFMTAKVRPDELDGYRRLGAFDVIIKPFAPLSLAAELEARWRNFHRIQGG